MAGPGGGGRACCTARKITQNLGKDNVGYGILFQCSAELHFLLMGQIFNPERPVLTQMFCPIDMERISVQWDG